MKGREGGRDHFAVVNDDSLFVTEDGIGTTWRVTYQGSARSH
jgi:hypothetical protein